MQAVLAAYLVRHAPRVIEKTARIQLLAVLHAHSVDDDVIMRLAALAVRVRVDHRLIAGGKPAGSFLPQLICLLRR